MNRYLYLYCQFFIILILLSCEKQEIIKLEDPENIQFSSAKKPFESDFSDFDFNKYNIEPIWSQAIALPGKVLEVPFKVKNETFIPKLDSYQSRNNDASARLILYKESGITVAKIIYYFPSGNFKGNLDEINAHTIKSLKFSGLYMHQKLGESEIHIRFTEEGKITDRKTGTKDEAKKNGRVMACQLWGLFSEQYNEYGQVIYSILLDYWRVCDGGSPEEDQAPPASEGYPINNYGAANQQLLLNVKSVFYWLTGFPESWASIIRVVVKV